MSHYRGVRCSLVGRGLVVGRRRRPGLLLLLLLRLLIGRGLLMLVKRLLVSSKIGLLWPWR